MWNEFRVKHPEELVRNNFVGHFIDLKQEAVKEGMSAVETSNHVESEKGKGREKGKVSFVRCNFEK